MHIVYLEIICTEKMIFYLFQKTNVTKCYQTFFKSKKNVNKVNRKR